MHRNAGTRTTGRSLRTASALAVLFAGTISIAGCASASSATSPVTSPATAKRDLKPGATSHPDTTVKRANGALPGRPTATWGPDGAVNQADGVLPDGVTVFDGKYPGIAKIDSALLTALRHAAKDARGDGVRFVVHSAWRSPEYQARLLDEAIAKYGSRKKAARWVATPETSAHVSGDAIDLESAASDWLSKHGVHYGLCRIYRNEAWHYELRPEAVEHGCPALYADAAHDPRMQR